MCKFILAFITSFICSSLGAYGQQGSSSGQGICPCDTASLWQQAIEKDNVPFLLDFFHDSKVSLGVYTDDDEKCVLPFLQKLVRLNIISPHEVFYYDDEQYLSSRRDIDSMPIGPSDTFSYYSGYFTPFLLTCKWGSEEQLSYYIENDCISYIFSKPAYYDLIVKNLNYTNLSYFNILQKELRVNVGSVAFLGFLARLFSQKQENFTYDGCSNFSSIKQTQVFAMQYLDTLKETNLMSLFNVICNTNCELAYEIFQSDTSILNKNIGDICKLYMGNCRQLNSLLVFNDDRSSFSDNKHILYCAIMYYDYEHGYRVSLIEEILKKGGGVKFHMDLHGMSALFAKDSVNQIFELLSRYGFDICSQIPYSHLSQDNGGTYIVDFFWHSHMKEYYTFQKEDMTDILFLQNVVLSNYITDNGCKISSNGLKPTEAILFEAVKNRNIELIELVRGHLTTIDVKDENGRTPLQLAVENHDMETANYLEKIKSSLKTVRKE